MPKLMKGKKRTSMILLFVSMFCSNMLNAQTLVIWQKDGSKAHFNLNEQPKTTFTTTDLVITSEKSVVSYPLSNILRYTYESDALGINDPKVENIAMKQSGDDIILVGIPKGKTADVFATDGKLLMSHQSNGERLTFSLSQLPAGVYIIKAGTIYYKFMKR